MIDPVDSQNDTLGQTYRASIDEPVVVDGQTLIPRGADVIAKLVDDKQSGKIEGRTVLTLDLLQVQVNGGHGGCQHHRCQSAKRIAGRA